MIEQSVRKEKTKKTEKGQFTSASGNAVIFKPPQKKKTVPSLINFQTQVMENSLKSDISASKVMKVTTSDTLSDENRFTCRVPPLQPQSQSIMGTVVVTETNMTVDKNPQNVLETPEAVK